MSREQVFMVLCFSFLFFSFRISAHAILGVLLIYARDKYMTQNKKYAVKEGNLQKGTLDVVGEQCTSKHRQGCVKMAIWC